MAPDRRESSFHVRDRPSKEERSSRKKRRHGDRGEEARDERHLRKKRKSKWDCKPVGLPDNLGQHLEWQFLYARYAEIVRMLNSELELHTKPHKEKPPSPQAIHGHGISAKEERNLDWVLEERARVIAELVKKDPSFQPLRDDKFVKKLYIPAGEYPNYDFYGAIFGPEGSTQQWLEKETGAKILLRGRASQQHKEKGKDGDKDRLHVLIVAEIPHCLTRAAEMVQKLLVPNQDMQHFAALKGIDWLCKKCGEKGHDALQCPSLHLTSDSPVLCKVCGSGVHSTIACPRIGQIHGDKADNAGPSARSSFKSDAVCRMCNEGGHSTIECPKMDAILRSASSTSSVLCQKCGDGGHLTIDCPKMGFVNLNKTNIVYPSRLSFHIEIPCRKCGIGSHSTVDCPILGAFQGIIMNNTHHSDIPLLKTDVLCRTCAGSGHSAIDCPALSSYKGDSFSTAHAFSNSTFTNSLQCRICGDGGHPALRCPMLVLSEMSEWKYAKDTSVSSSQQQHGNSALYLMSGQNLYKDSIENLTLGNLAMPERPHSAYGCRSQNLFGPLHLAPSTSLLHGPSMVRPAVVTPSRPGVLPGLQQQAGHINHSSSLQHPDQYLVPLSYSTNSAPPSQLTANGYVSSTASRALDLNSTKEPKHHSLLESEYERFLSEVD